MDSHQLQTCQRCFCREPIPTHQFVKFDLKVYYLCQRCWEKFRSWFHWGRLPAGNSTESQ